MLPCICDVGAGSILVLKRLPEIYGDLGVLQYHMQ